MNVRCASLLFVLAIAPGPAAARSESVADRFETIDGLRLHYLTAGSGPVVVLLHGYAQTSRMWRPLIPQLAGRFTVIAPDLPGIGASDIPKDRVDMKSAAASIHALVKQLGVAKAAVVGHDIGLMVAYAYAAQFPSGLLPSQRSGCLGGAQRAPQRNAVDEIGARLAAG